MPAARSSITLAMVLAGLALFLGADQFSGQSPPVARAASFTVSITGSGYSPQTITIAAGDTVTWTNNSTAVQTVNSTLSGTDPNFFYSAFIYQGNSWSHTFPNTGTFGYRSTTTGITGTVIVTAGGGGATSTPTPTPTQSGGGGGGGASVSITSGGYVPQSITVAAGTTVTWTNNSTAVQTVNSTLSGTDPNFFYSAFIYQGNSWSHTFANAGTFGYRSTTTGITGTVVVTGGGGGSPTNTPTPAPTNTPTPTSTSTPTPGGGAPTATPTATPASTSTPTPGGSATATPTPTFTPTPSGSPTPTSTATATPSPTSTGTTTPSPTPTPTKTPGLGQSPPGPFGPMQAGWNLATYSGPAASPSTGLASLGNNYVAVYHWDGTRYLRFFRPGLFPEYLNSLTQMAPGQVFWISLTAPVP